MSALLGACKDLWWPQALTEQLPGSDEGRTELLALAINSDVHSRNNQTVVLSRHQKKQVANHLRQQAPPDPARIGAPSNSPTHCHQLSSTARYVPQVHSAPHSHPSSH